MASPEQNPIRLSLVMLAKDEEACLGRALASARQWVDEIVLVDTGSRDRTVEVAQGFGARVFHHPWENDFAKHRNQALAQARGEWCLHLDADEALDAQTASALPGLMARRDVAAYLVEIVNLYASGQRDAFHWPRLFRRLPGVRYHRPVHNTIHIPGPKAPCPLRILHYGYDGSQDYLGRKRERRLAMIGEWAAREPENWEAHCYLAQALHSWPGQRQRALDAALRALELLRGQGRETAGFARAYYPLLNVLAQKGRAAEVIRHGLDCAAAAPDHPDAYLFLAWAFHSQGDWARALWAGRRFASLQDQWGQWAAARPGQESHTQGHMNFVCFRWAEAAARLGREGEMGQVVKRMLEQWDAEGAVRQLVQTLAGLDLDGAAELAARLAAEAHPQWAWPGEMLAASPQATPTSGPSDHQARPAGMI